MYHKLLLQKFIKTTEHGLRDFRFRCSIIKWGFLKHGGCTKMSWMELVDTKFQNSYMNKKNAVGCSSWKTNKEMLMIMSVHPALV